MFVKIKKAMCIVLNPELFKRLISMGMGGYLYEIGWINSFTRKLPVNKENEPLPWVTYSFIYFISERLNNNMDVFEYGSGNSTLWYAQKVCSVTSVEHDKKWFEKVQNAMPENAIVHYEELVYGGDYSKFSNQVDKQFDIIVVDGRDRVNCLKESIDGLKKEGIVILDDSERKEYLEGIEYMIDNGYRRIDFWGISPGLFYKKCTSIFYKNENCLGI